MNDKDYHNLIYFIKNQKFPIGLTKSYKNFLEKKCKKFTMAGKKLYIEFGDGKKEVVVDEEIRKKCLTDCHIENGNHLNRVLSLTKLKSKYHWKNMFIDFEHFYNNCNLCNVQKSRCFNLVEISFCGPYSSCNQNEFYVMKITDFSSNFTILRLCSSGNINEIVLCVIESFCSFGFPFLINLKKQDSVDCMQILSMLIDYLKGWNKHYNLSDNENCILTCPEITPRILDTSMCNSLKKVILKAMDGVKTFAPGNVYINLACCKFSILPETISSFQEDEISRLVNDYPQKWTSLLPILMFKFNNMVYQKDDKIPSFHAVFYHSSFKSFYSNNDVLGSLLSSKSYTNNGEDVSLPPQKRCIDVEMQSGNCSRMDTETYVVDTSLVDQKLTKSFGNESIQNEFDEPENVVMDDDADKRNEIHITLVAEPGSSPTSASQIKDDSNSSDIFTKGDKDIPSDIKCLRCCVEGIKIKEEMQLHIKCHNDDTSSLKCHLCKETKEQWDEMLAHITDHHYAEDEVKEFLECTNILQCRICEKVFKNKKSLKEHCKLHEQVSFNCNMCNFVTQNKRYLTRHQLLHDGSSYQCSECEKSFPTKSALKSHSRVHEKVSNRVTCKQCGLSLKSDVTLKAHIIGMHSNSESMACSKCDYIGKNKTRLKNHYQRIHNKVHQCDSCDYSTSRISALEKHKSIFHDAENRPFVCPHCNYRSSNNRRLTEHIRFKHNPNISRYKCQKCNMKFKTITRLRDHMPLHTGELLYGCKLCGYRAKHRQTAYYHAKSKHRGHPIKDVIETPGPESIERTKKMVNCVESKCHKNEKVSLSTSMESDVQFQEIQCEECEVVVQSDQGFDSYSLSESRLHQLILQNTDEIKVIEVDTSTGNSLFSIETANDKSKHEDTNRDELQGDLNGVSDSGRELPSAESNHLASTSDSKSVELVFLSMPESI